MGGGNLFVSPSLFNLFRSHCLLSTFLNCARSWRVTTSAYSGARSTTYSRRQLCVQRKIVVIHCRGQDELHREMGTNGDVREENAMEWHQCARTHGFQYPKTSSKTTYRSGRGVSTMGMILLITLSTISPTYIRYAKMGKCSSYHCMHCS